MAATSDPHIEAQLPTRAPAADPNGSPVDKPEVVEAHEEERPTDSHVLAHSDIEEKGVAQIKHGQTEVRDLGWDENPTDIPNPLVGGLPNEELWTLVRRFNKVRF